MQPCYRSYSGLADSGDPMFEPQMKPTERKLIILLFVVILCSLAAVTCHHLSVAERKTKARMSILVPRFARAEMCDQRTGRARDFADALPALLATQCAQQPAV
jgi:hypothetical protein